MKVFELPENEYNALRDAPAFDAVIPANVRYDDRLSMGAKLIYGEIRSLSRREGYCWASNEYFAKLYKTHTNTVSRWISELSLADHIDITIDKALGNRRALSLSVVRGVSPKIVRPITKNGETSHQKWGGHLKKINKKINKKKELKKEIYKERKKEKESPNSAREDLQQHMERMLTFAKSKQLIFPPALEMKSFREAWMAFIEYRQRLRAPMTIRIQNGILRKLNERPGLAADLLDLIMERGWRGVEWSWYDKTKGRREDSKI